MLIISGAVKTKSPFCFLCAKPEQIYSKHYGCISMSYGWQMLLKARGEASTNQTVCTVYLESVHHHPPTHTYTHTHMQHCCFTISHSLYISLFSLFSFQEQGAGSHLLIGFCRENVFARLFLLNTPGLPSPQMIPLSLAPANSAEHSQRLVILQRSLNPQSCRGFKNTSPRPGICKVFKGGNLLPYTCFTKVENYVTLLLKGSINKCKVPIMLIIGAEKLHITAFQKEILQVS